MLPQHTLLRLTPLALPLARQWYQTLHGGRVALAGHACKRHGFPATRRPLVTKQGGWRFSLCPTWEQGGGVNDREPAQNTIF
jgi:hypothetical protein